MDIGFEVEEDLFVTRTILAWLSIAAGCGLLVLAFYCSPDGKDRSEMGTVATHPSRYKIGESVTVLFDPQTGDSRLTGWLDVHGGSVALTCTSGIFVVIGFVALLNSRWWE